MLKTATDSVKELVKARMTDSRYMEALKEKPLMSLKDKDKDMVMQGQKNAVSLPAAPEKKNKMIRAETGVGQKVRQTLWKNIWPTHQTNKK